MIDVSMNSTITDLKKSKIGTNMSRGGLKEQPTGDLC